MEKKVLEDIKNNVEDNIKEEKENPFKKILLIILSFFLILLMISYIFVSFPIGKIISGQLESTPINNNIIKFDDFNIIFDQESLDKLNEIYLKEQEVEFSICLSGKISNDIYHITNLYQPKVYQQSFNQITFAPCPKNTLIMLHSHPYKSCLASSTDLETLNESKQNNPNLIMVVMCELGRFSIYR